MRRLEVLLGPSDVWAEVKGYGSRELLTELKGRPPVWTSRSRAWSVSGTTARDVIAVAESRGYVVTVRDLAKTAQALESPASARIDEPSDRDGGLW